MSKAFGPGTEIQLDLIASNGICHSRQTKVRDCHPDALVLYAPMEQGIAAYIPVGSKVTLWQQGENEAYVATVRVTAIRPEMPPLIVTTAPSKVEVTPRRRFFRASTRLPFRAGATNGEVRDISGNGALVCVPPGSLREGKVMRVEIGIPGLALPLRMEAKVVRVFQIDGEEHAGLAFERVNETVRDHIIRHVFIRQRERQAALRHGS